MTLFRVTAWMLVRLFCVLPIAVATFVDNIDPRIRYTGSGWTTDDNPKNNGGSANRTNVKGDSASFNFTGNAVALYGASQEGGAAFSFTVDGTSKMCTCYQNETSEIQYQTPLCSVPDLVPTFHTLIITHAGSNGLWLNIDDLQVALNEATTSLGVTASTLTSTSTKTSTSVTSSTTSPVASTRSSKGSHRGVLIGGIVGGTVALLCMLGGIAFLCFKSFHGRQTRGQYLKPQTQPDYMLLSTADPGNTRPSMELPSHSPGIVSPQPVQNRVSGAQGALEYAASPRRYAAGTSTSGSSSRGSEVPPPSLASRIERSNQSTTQQSSTSSRSDHLRTAPELIAGRGDISFYFPGVSAATPSARHTPPSSLSSSSSPAQPPRQHPRLPLAERRRSSATSVVAPRPRRFRALPDIWGERRRRDSQFDGYSDVLHTRSELASPPPLSSVSPPPPSYRTATPSAFQTHGGQRV